MKDMSWEISYIIGKFALCETPRPVQIFSALQETVKIGAIHDVLYDKISYFLQR